ncbi:ABC transporter permease [Mycoplasma marinum]|uniref:ABC transporter permease n=1 Tax=Mycoplasma marinum TaxID=1937190 RepID=A0A4R0XL84_9MOLU|nr:hypothetical protein [Mycoplasma marinum]TCG11426.1 hypothetical protein C4B24_02025 [Mycoplasma marinum]
MNLKINDKINSFGKTILSNINGEKSKGIFHKFKASIIAILIGFLIGAIPILAVGGNVFSTYTELFLAPLKSFQINMTVTLISIVILLGVGIGISFKSGLFNIGAPGQFLVAGAFTTMMGIQLNMSKGISIPLMILVAALAGAIVAAIAGILKAFFNVHEVVSTILLNWTFFYFIKWIFKMKKFKSPTMESSKNVHESMQFDLTFNSMEPWIIFAITILIVVIIWFIFRFTTFGFKMKANGMSKSATKYAGINVKVTTILSMALSGAVIGVAGFIYYSTYQGMMPELTDLPPLAFESITVALLAFSSPLGCIFAGTFYGLVYKGIPLAAVVGNVPGETINLVLGLIIFFAALAPLFMKFKPYLWIQIKIYEYKSEELSNKKIKMTNAVKELKKENNIKKKLIKEKNNAQSIRYKELLLKYKGDNKKLQEIVFEEKLVKYIKRQIQKEWTNEINIISVKFKKKEIDLLEKDILLKTINLKYKNLFSEHKLDEEKHEKETFKFAIRTLKNNYKLDLQDSWEAHRVKIKTSKQGGK